MIVREALVVVLLAAPASSVQVGSRVEALIDAVRPALPFPAADAGGELPAQGGADSRWFVVWPTTSDDPRIHVKANPLHPETQAAGAAAMARIQAAVVEAERKAQAAYDRALEELRRTGRSTSLDGVTLEDEGVAGQRIDAELELTIDLGVANSYEIGSSESPETTAGTNGVTWSVATKPNTYRDGATARDHFRPAETRLIFGNVPRPTVRRIDDTHRFAVTIGGDPAAFAVVLRGNEQLLKQVLAEADWSRLARQR
ncbi:MAG: hypothetical protein ACRD2A_22230 [Vicinamibacterales bacterium]